MYSLLDQPNIIYKGRATADEIRQKELFGYTHFLHDGISYFLYINDEYDRERLQNYIGLPDYKWFHETTGNKNWVLYDPKLYRIDKNWEGKTILKFNLQEYHGEKLSTPVNASSLCGLFSWLKLPENLNFGTAFYLDDIVDLSLMFCGTTLPANYDFGRRFNTKHIENMRYMFYKCNIPSSVKLPEKFFTTNVRNMEYMFAEMFIPTGFSLGENFDTSKVRDMNHMFFNCTFDSRMDFGNKFEISSYTDTSFMFAGATSEGKAIVHSDNVRPIIQALQI